MDSRKSHVGFVGLGAMGMGMARVLLREGFPVRGYDINPQALTSLAAAGGEAARSPADAAASADVLLIMVVDGEQAETVLFGDDGAAAALPKGRVVLLCSTVSPAFARRTAARLKAMDLEMLDAPVSGGVVGAAGGTLSIMAAGPAEAFAACEDMLRALGKNVYYIGDQPGQGSMMKTVNQLLCGVHLAAAAEAMALGVRAGIAPQRVFEVVSHSAGTSWMLENRVPRMLAGEYTPPQSAVDIFIKDLGIVLESGDELRFPLPLAAVARQLFLMAAAAGYARQDDAAVVRVYEQLAGIRVGTDLEPAHTP